MVTTYKPTKFNQGEAFILHMFILRIVYSVLHLRNSSTSILVKISMIYAQSSHWISSTTPNNYTVPRLLCKVQFSDHVTSFPATMKQQFLTLSILWLLRRANNRGGPYPRELNYNRTRKALQTKQAKAVLIKIRFAFAGFFKIRCQNLINN